MPYENNTGFPSVTEIIKPYIDTEWFRQEHLDRGSAVHAAMEAHALCLYVPPLRPKWQPYFDSGRKWFDASVDEVYLVEKRLIDKKLGYCGKPDIVCAIKGDSRIILPDYKTSQTYQSWWEIQGAAYKKLVTGEGIPCHQTISVRTKKDGSGCLINEHKNESAFNIFIGLLNAHQFFKKEKTNA